MDNTDTQQLIIDTRNRPVAVDSHLSGICITLIEPACLPTTPVRGTVKSRVHRQQESKPHLPRLCLHAVYFQDAQKAAGVSDGLPSMGIDCAKRL